MTESTQVHDGLLNLSDVDLSLDQILNSTGFRGSAQLQNLLKYIVEASINGRGEALKERIIGIDVFKRKSDYDTADDPIVRSRVGLLRKRLAQYYESAESRGTAVQIVIPNGSYRPTFVFHPEAGAKTFEEPHVESTTKVSPPMPALVLAEECEVEPLPVAARSIKKSSWRTWTFAAGLICAFALSGWAIATHWYRSELYLVWKPIFESKKTVLLYTGTISPVYLRESTNSVPLGQKEQELPSLASSLITPEADSPDPKTFVALRDGLVPPGDITADMRIATLLNSFHSSVSLRYGSGLPFVDMKVSPTVLIGAYDNYWTLELARDLPFFFDRGGQIRERNAPHRIWSSMARADSVIHDDYAVIFRLTDSKTGGPVIAISGLTTCGTQAAAEFMTDATQLKKLSEIPRSALEYKNFEFVLHTSLENCTPTSADVVAQQVW